MGSIIQAQTILVNTDDNNLFDITNIILADPGASIGEAPIARLKSG
jgi:hypothetical protein